MKKKNKFQRSLIALGSVTAVVAPTLVVVSCSKDVTSKADQRNLSNQILNGYLKDNKFIPADGDASKNKDFNISAIKKIFVGNSFYRMEPFLKKNDDKSKNISEQVYQKLYEKLFGENTSDVTKFKKTKQAIINLIPKPSDRATFKTGAGDADKDYGDVAKNYSPDPSKQVNDGSKLKFRSFSNSSYIQTLFSYVLSDQLDLKTFAMNDSIDSIAKKLADLINMSPSANNDTRTNQLELAKFMWAMNDSVNRRNYSIIGINGGYAAIGDFYSYKYKGKKQEAILDKAIQAYSLEIVKDGIQIVDVQKALGDTFQKAHPEVAAKIVAQGNYFKESVTSTRVVESSLDWFTKYLFYTGQQEYENWWPYEIHLPQYLLGTMKQLVNTKLTTRINEWMKPYQYFAGDPLYQHAAPTSINNGIHAVKTMNYGANLADNSCISLIANLVSGDIVKARKNVNDFAKFLFEEYTPKHSSGFRRDGGFVMHGDIPYQSHYGFIIFEDALKMQNIVKGTSLDLFANFPQEMNNMFRTMVDSYLPLFFKGQMSEMTMGRFYAADDADTMKDGNGASIGLDVIKTFSTLVSYAPSNKYRDILVKFLDKQIGGGQAIQFKGSTAAQREKDAKDNHGIDMTYKSFLPKSFEGDYLSHLVNNNGKSDGEFQIWSNGLTIANHRDKSGEVNWQFSTKTQMDGVGVYEDINADGTQGFYMSDGLQLLKTKENPEMYNGTYWSGVDPYSLPGVVSYTPKLVPNIDKYNVLGYSSGKDDTALEQADGSWEDKLGAKITDLRIPNEWPGGKWGAWASHESHAKSMTDGIGFAGGATLDGMTANMAKTTSYDNNVTQQKSYFTLGDDVLVLGYVNNPNDKFKSGDSRTQLTVDNRMSTGTNTGFTKGTVVKAKEPGSTVWQDAQQSQPFDYKGDNGEKIAYTLYGVDGKIGADAKTSSELSGEKINPGQSYLGKYKTNADIPFKLAHATKTASNLQKGDVEEARQFNMLKAGISNGGSYAYTISPNGKHEINKDIKILRNDNIAQIVSYHKGKEDYLFVNVFQNTNDYTTINWVDPNAPMHIGTTKPTSMIFKRDSGYVDLATINDGSKSLKELTESQKSFTVAAQSAMHDGSPTTIKFVKLLSKFTIPYENFNLYKNEDNPMYWTDRQNAYQNGPYKTPMNIASQDFYRTHTQAYVSEFEASLHELDKTFSKPDQITLHPDERFEYQSQFVMGLTFV